MNNIPLSIYILPLLALLLSGCKLAKKKTYHEDFLDYSTIKGLQGFVAMAIILHHLTQIVTQYGQYNVGLINIFVNAGVLFTGFFFFCSGYGLMTSVLKKEDYLDGFIRKRLPTIIVPFFVCNWLFVAVSFILGYSAKPLDIITYIFGIVLMNDQMWFIVELAILYVAFYFIYRKRKSDTRALVMMAVDITFMTVGSLLLGHDNLPFTLGKWFHGEWWYNTTWLFFVGLLVAKNKNRLVDFAKKHYAWLLPVMVVLYLGMTMATSYVSGIYGYYTQSNMDKVITAIVQCLMVVVFVLGVLLITMKLRLKNLCMSYLGKLTLEIYLLQNIFITYLRPVLGRDLLFYLGVYVCTILLAIGVHWVNQRVIAGLSKL